MDLAQSPTNLSAICFAHATTQQNKDWYTFKNDSPNAIAECTQNVLQTVRLGGQGVNIRHQGWQQVGVIIQKRRVAGLGGLLRHVGQAIQAS